MKKRRNRICRRIAVALTVALLVGQSHTFVLAEEGDTSQTEISSEETETDHPGSDNTGNTDNGLEQGDNNNEAGGQNPEDNKNDGDQQDGEDKCVCGTKCTEDAVNTECPVCATDYANCAGKADDEGNDDSGNSNTGDNDAENDDTENNAPEDGDQNNIGDNPESNMEETALETVLPEDEGIVTLADEGVEVYAVGDTFTYSGIKYAVTAGDEVEVCKQDSDEIADVVIPNEVKDGSNSYRVTSIGREAFINCRNLSKIVLPNGVTSIGSFAFSNCSNLTSIEMPDGVKSIGFSAFSNCNSLMGVTIPDSVVSIGPSAFNSCRNLESVKISNNVTSIQGSTFSGCIYLRDVELPKSVRSIEEAAFYQCTSMRTVKISNSLTSIGKNALNGCRSLYELQIVVPSGERLQLPKIEEGAFPKTENERYIHFFDEMGKELTGMSMDDAKAVFLEAAKNDGSNDGKWYGWSIDRALLTYYIITASAAEGGTISQSGDISAIEGTDMTFTITPDEKKRIKTVTVDGSDVTANLADTVTRAQTGARYYTFTNITQNHSIHAEFERDGGDNPNPNPDSGGDNAGGGDSPTPGGDGGNNGGGSTNPDGGNTANPGNGNDAGNMQTAAGTEISSAQAGSNAVGASAGSSAAGVTTAGASGQTAGGNGTAAGGKEPKTGDASHMEVYATLAMIAGLTYLLLYIMEESRGMSEREKEAAVAALIRWGKKGGSFRKCCAMAAIFGLLMYYHAIGKRGQRNDMIFKVS